MWLYFFEILVSAGRGVPRPGRVLRLFSAVHRPEKFFPNRFSNVLFKNASGLKIVILYGMFIIVSYDPRVRPDQLMSAAVRVFDNSDFLSQPE